MFMEKSNECGEMFDFSQIKKISEVFEKSAVLCITSSCMHMYYLYKTRYKYRNLRQCKNLNLTIFQTITN